MASHSESFLDLFIQACRRVAEAGLIRCSSGNLSSRVSDDMIAVSARGAWLERIKKNQVAQCRLRDGAAVTDVVPSVELHLHLGVMRVRPDVRVVLHFQSPFATTIACGAAARLNFSVIPEIPLYVGVPAVVGYFTPGSTKLADEVSRAMADHNMVIMQNHGLVAAGKDYDEVIQKACFMELASQIILSEQARPMSAQQIDALKEYLPTRQPPPIPPIKDVRY